LIVSLIFPSTPTPKNASLRMVQTKFSDHDEGESFDYKKNNWKALIGTRLNSNSNSFFEIPIMPT
jgi:hypothetical protein